jgi:hypothetical protein
MEAMGRGRAHSEAALLASQRRSLIVAPLLVMTLTVHAFGGFVVWLLYDFVISGAQD